MARKRVLIVEDETSLRNAMREVVDWFGYQPVEAADGAEGLAKAEHLNPDLVLLDVEMPGLSGYEVCRRLKANPTTRPIPVIFVTAWQGEAVHRLASAMGAVACLTKPFRLVALEAVIEGALTASVRPPTPRTSPGGETQTPWWGLTR